MRRPDDPIALLSDLLRDGNQQMAVVDTTICGACGEHHLAEVESRGPNGGYGWHCPEAGFVAAVPDAVAALSIVTNCVVT